MQLHDAPTMIPATPGAGDEKFFIFASGNIHVPALQSPKEPAGKEAHEQPAPGAA